MLSQISLETRLLFFDLSFFTSTSKRNERDIQRYYSKAAYARGRKHNRPNISRNERARRCRAAAAAERRTNSRNSRVAPTAATDLRSAWGRRRRGERGEGGRREGGRSDRSDPRAGYHVGGVLAKAKAPGRVPRRGTNVDSSACQEGGRGTRGEKENGFPSGADLISVTRLASDCLTFPQERSRRGCERASERASLPRAASVPRISRDGATTRVLTRYACALEPSVRKNDDATGRGYAIRRRVRSFRLIIPRPLARILRAPSGRSPVATGLGFSCTKIRIESLCKITRDSPFIRLCISHEASVAPRRREIRSIRCIPRKKHRS